MPDLEPGVGAVLQGRWTEARRCLDSRAYLAAIAMMGGLLEGRLLVVCQRNPKSANAYVAAPKGPQSVKAKRFLEWSLAEMTDVAHSTGWLDPDVKRFGHELRSFRNLVHPYEQMAAVAKPDEDTCGISWLVVQAPRLTWHGQFRKRSRSRISTSGYGKTEKEEDHGTGTGLRIHCPGSEGNVAPSSCQPR